MLRVSTGYKTLDLAGHSFKSMFDFGALLIYATPRPASADDVPGGLPIAAITNEGLPWDTNFNGYGLVFDLDGPYALGSETQSWQLVPNANAIGNDALWWRLVAPGDDNLPSITRPRMDGNVGLESSPSGEEMLLDSLELTPGVVTPFSTFFFTIS